jgi:hypothetical protein
MQSTDRFSCDFGEIRLAKRLFRDGVLEQTDKGAENRGAPSFTNLKLWFWTDSTSGVENLNPRVPSAYAFPLGKVMHSSGGSRGLLTENSHLTKSLREV